MPFVLGGKLPVRGNSGTSRPIRYSGSGTLFSTAYSYQNISDTQTTPRVRFRNVRVGDSGTLLEGKRYEYDTLGNITRISQSVSPYYPLVEYSYDSQNQLIKETYYDGSGTGTAHITDYYDYTYDTAGNLLTAAKNGTVTQTYTYGDSDWKDLLTSVNGASISYDSSGNPTSYSNSRGSYTYLRWDKGRQLSAIMVRVSGMEYATYDYDVNGIRTRKELNESGYIYYTQNGKLMREVGQFDGVTKRQVIDFIYDESGRPFAMNYSTDSGNSFTKYYYILNLQGDVVKLVTASGSEVASYAYDAWGNILSQSGSMADKNPLRYRGYYYDVETGFYYLQSRYYDPANRRFINADSYVSVDNSFVGVNLFAYCLNSPVGLRDDGGTSPYDFLGILDFYLIHKRVQEDVRRQYGWEMEVYVVGPNGKGRLDLYDVENNAYYEVKSAGVLLRQSGIKSLEKQLAKYDVALPTKYPDVCTPPSRGTTHVSGNFEYGFYDIEYKTTADGLILYTYTFNRKRARETALNALASLGVLAIVALAGLFGVPAEGALAPA